MALSFTLPMATYPLMGNKPLVYRYLDSKEAAPQTMIASKRLQSFECSG